ncbi:MAG: hypothetical protein GQ574_10385 [Crocinitomix sp.]|nr:hypothetical protein [Crocinitomix sp.]
MSLNSLFSWIIKKRIHQIDLFKQYPFEVQREVFTELISRGSKTEWGKKYDFANIKSYEDFNEKVPLANYEVFEPYIKRLLNKEQKILWDSDVKWFAQTSGTMGDRIKVLPVSKESLYNCHYKGGKDLLSLYYNQIPGRKLYKGKHLILGGSAKVHYLTSDSYFGDISAIILKNMPWWAELRRTPAKEIALMSEWEEKIERLAESTIKQDIYILAGVPSWTLILCNRVLEMTGKKHLREVWPNLELFMHGGVNFEPYRNQFKKIIPFDDMHYVETYNASEGFFGIQDDFKIDELLLMLDYGTFFEFIPMDQFDDINSKKVIPLQEVEMDVNYALVISTNAGLWRYIIGDTIRFTNMAPYRFKITGRTKSFINSFGEKLEVEHAEMAIRKTCEQTKSEIAEYTVAPVYMDGAKLAKHEWLIEFRVEPDSLTDFTQILDEELQVINMDYKVKRTGDITLLTPLIHSAEKGLFQKWLKSINKLGGQHKVPRLCNDRKMIEQLLSIQPNIPNSLSNH